MKSKKTKYISESVFKKHAELRAIMEDASNGLGWDNEDAYSMNIDGYVFRCTCVACPEQYDVYLGDKYVAYVRKRWGHLRVYPTINHEVDWSTVIYEKEDDDEYCGTIDDRENTLKTIVEKIKKYYDL